MSVFMDCDAPYRPACAGREVQDLRSLLERQAITTTTLEEALLGNVSGGNPAGARDIRATLERLAAAAVSADSAERRRRIEAALAHMTDEELLVLILHRPRLSLVPDPELQRISPDTGYEQYTIQPLFGLIFPRDHFIVTNRGVLIGNFRRKDRRRETAVVEAALANIALRPIARCPADRYLEGGDFLAAEAVSYIAVGLRTSVDAVTYLLSEDLFGTDHVVVMRDMQHRRDHFHLDHYFNVLSENVVAIAAERMDDPAELLCDLYVRNAGGSYRQAATGQTFARAAARLGVRCIAVAPADVQRMATNFLNVGSDTIICPAGLSAAFLDTLRHEGLSVHEVQFTEMHKQHGSVHCAAVVVERASQAPEGGRPQKPGGPGGLSRQAPARGGRASERRGVIGAGPRPAE